MGWEEKKDTHPLERMCGTMAQTRDRSEGVWEGLRRVHAEAASPGWALGGMWDLQIQSLSFTVSF